MKIDSYTINPPIPGMCKQHAAWIMDGNVISPLIYFQRPKWITNDAAWEQIAKSVRLDLPSGFHVD